jgi:hypothetical protein
MMLVKTTVIEHPCGMSHTIIHISHLTSKMYSHKPFTKQEGVQHVMKHYLVCHCTEPLEHQSQAPIFAQGDEERGIECMPQLQILWLTLTLIAIAHSSDRPS